MNGMRASGCLILFCLSCSLTAQGSGECLCDCVQWMRSRILPLAHDRVARLNATAARRVRDSCGGLPSCTARIWQLRGGGRGRVDREVHEMRGSPGRESAEKEGESSQMESVVEEVEPSWLHDRGETPSTEDSSWNKPDAFDEILRARARVANVDAQNGMPRRKSALGGQEGAGPVDRRAQDGFDSDEEESEEEDEAAGGDGRGREDGAYIEHHGHKVPLVGSAGRDVRFLRRLATVWGDQGHSMKVVVPEHMRDKFAEQVVDVDEELPFADTSDDSSAGRLPEQGVDKRSAARQTRYLKEAKSMLKRDIFFSVSSSSSDAETAVGGNDQEDSSRESKEHEAQLAARGPWERAMARAEGGTRRQGLRGKNCSEADGRGYGAETQQTLQIEEEAGWEAGEGGGGGGLTMPPAPNSWAMARRLFGDDGHRLLDSMRRLGSGANDSDRKGDVAAEREGGRGVAGWGGPTLVQGHAWRVMVLGRDLILVAPTGTGKTLAYLLPGLLRCSREFASPLLGGAAAAPALLVVAPTRELAMQIQGVAEAVLRRRATASGRIQSVCVVGGMPKAPQRTALQNLAVACVIGTPGRLVDLAIESERAALVLDKVRVFVADEADRLMDLGMREVLERLLKATHRSRQVALVSATWRPDLDRDLVRRLTSSPVFLRISGRGSASGANGASAGGGQGGDNGVQGWVLPKVSEGVTQVVEVLEKRHRDARLMDLLEDYHGAQRCCTRVLIFCLYKREAEHVAKLLKQTVYRASLLTGSMRQNERVQALRLFARGTRPLLVATDVAGRGLDVADVAYVINYGLPLTIEAYVHRVGRCGRAGRRGVSHSFVTKNDASLAASLAAVLRAAKQVVPAELARAFDLTLRRPIHAIYGDQHKPVAASAAPSHVRFSADDEQEPVAQAG